MPTFKNEERTAKQGLATADDFRFIRTAWETPINRRELTSRRWFHFAKGGAYSQFYADIHLKVLWAQHGRELSSFSGSVIRNSNFYSRAGMTWTNSTTRELSVRALPRGCVFGHMGPSAFVECPEILAMIGVIHSSTIAILIKIQQGLADAGRKNYEVGIINQIPFPHLNNESIEALDTITRHAGSLKRVSDTANLTSHAFCAPALAPSRASSTPDIK